MKKTAVMQPYLFPYIGYFQLIDAVDTFVIFDDVQYITGGWINRNRILQNGTDHLFTFSLQNDSSRKNINERYFTGDLTGQRQKFLKTLQFAYGQAPYFDRTKQLVEQVFERMRPTKTSENIALKIGRSIRTISYFLHLETDFVASSAIDKDNRKSGQELIIEINNRLQSDTYINPVNGRELYGHDRFDREGIDLFFLKPQMAPYKQFTNEFIPWLSIIDVCMFNSKDEISELLKSFSLVS